MTSRLLPYEEWSKLEGTEAENIWPLLDPTRATVIVVEHGGAIVGTWVLMNVLHAECLWIAPPYRGKASVARRLWAALRRTADEQGVPVVATSAMTEQVRVLLEHIGAIKVPGDHYAMRVH